MRLILQMLQWHHLNFLNIWSLKVWLDLVEKPQNRFIAIIDSLSCHNSKSKSARASQQLSWQQRPSIITCRWRSRPYKTKQIFLQLLPSTSSKPKQQYQTQHHRRRHRPSANASAANEPHIHRLKRRKNRRPEKPEEQLSQQEARSSEPIVRNRKCKCIGIVIDWCGRRSVEVPGLWEDGDELKISDFMK